MQTTPIKTFEKPQKSKDLKSSIFTHKSNQTTFFHTGRNKRNNNLLDKNSSTNDSSDKKQINLNENKNMRFKTIKSESIKLKNVLRKIVKGNNNKNENNNKDEIKTRKNEPLIRNIIEDSVGRNNITISNLDKNHFRFNCKIYIDKKKAVFNLNLILEEKSRNIITGEFIEGDIQKYEKIFGIIKEKLE
jgi:ATP-dependent 26S proteasome regulatory subunit